MRRIVWRWYGFLKEYHEYILFGTYIIRDDLPNVLVFDYWQGIGFRSRAVFAEVECVCLALAFAQTETIPGDKSEDSKLKSG